MKAVDLGDGICLGNYESYEKLKSNFQKFIHVITYPNFKKIEEGPGNFVILNSEHFEHLTIRELDKFSYYPCSMEAESIFINSEDINAGAVVGVLCKATRNQDIFNSIADVAERVYRAYGKLPVFNPGQMEPGLRYFRRLIVEDIPQISEQCVLT